MIDLRFKQHTLLSVFKLNSFHPCQFKHSSLALEWTNSHKKWCQHGHDVNCTETVTKTKAWVI